MDVFDLFTLLGGLAFFLYGMSVMSSGLEKMVGGKLERVLKSMTSNKLKALTLGAVITIAIQSSSALTVMLVGLVNSGIMELSQTVGVIMGSSVGTTLTAWILSAAGIQGDNFFLQLLKPESFSPLVALLGVLLTMLHKNNSKKHDVGTILLGFSVLMTGMTLMSASVSGLKDIPEFQRILTMFNNPFAGVFIGTVFTGIIQSSAASVGILQSLSLTGSITFGMAFPIICGANIGTCATALLSCIGASKNAKRVAAVNLYFKVIGTVIVLGVFYGVHAIVHFDFVDQPISTVGVAIVHTLFNIINTVIFLPFMKQLEKLAVVTVREKPGDKEELLDERLLLSPGLAISECYNLTVRMAHEAKESIRLSIDLLENYDEDRAAAVQEQEDEVDIFEDKLGSYLVKLSSRDLTPADSATVSELLHAIGDFERISDHAVNILRAAEEIHDKELQFSEEAQKELRVMTQAVLDILDITVHAFEKQEPSIASQVEPLEQVIDELNTELRNRHVRRLQEGRCTIELGFVLTDLLTNYSRVSDHCSNVGVAVIQKKQSVAGSHEYLAEVKTSGGVEFTTAFEAYQKTYALPESK